MIRQVIDLPDHTRTKLLNFREGMQFAATIPGLERISKLKVDLVKAETPLRRSAERHQLLRELLERGVTVADAHLTQLTRVPRDPTQERTLE